MAGLLVEIALFSGILIAIISLQNRSVRRKLGVIIVLAVVIRVLALLVSTLLLDNPSDGGFAFSDDKNYHFVSTQMVELWNAGYSANPADIQYQAEKNQGYYYTNAALFWLFGSEILVASVFNIFVSVISILMVYRIGEQGWTPAVGFRAALIVALLPDIAVWSGLLFKDTIVGFLVLWSIFNLQRAALGEQKLIVVVQCVIALLLLYMFRAESSLLLVLAYSAAFITTRKGVRSSRVLLSVGAVVILLAVGTVVLNSLVQGYFVGAPVLDRVSSGAPLESAMLFASMLNYYSQSAIDSAGLISAGYIFGLQDLWRLPIAVIFVALIPFPPWPRGLSVAADMISVASIPWLVLLPLVLTATARAWRTQRDRAKVLLYYVTLDWVMLAVFLFAFNPTRHRLASVPLMLLLASAHWPKRGGLDWWIWMLGVAVMTLSMLVYPFL